MSELPKGWMNTSMSEILSSVVGGGTPSRKIADYFEGSIPWFTVKDMKTLRPSDSQDHISTLAIQDSATNLIPADTLIIATRIALGKAIKPKIECTINQDLKALFFHDGINSDFFLHWFITHDQVIQDLGSGTTVKGIRLENLHSLKVKLPPLNEQNRIVTKLEELLSDLDAGVSELKTAQAKLIQYRQSLLKAAVEGELTREWRESQLPNAEHETGEQLLERILLERRKRWETKQLAKFAEQGKQPPKDWQKKYPEPVQPDTTDLPVLPDGWVWTTIGQCFHVAVGATPSRKESTYWAGNIPWVSSGEVRFNRISDTKEKISEKGLLNSSTQLNPVGSVMLGMIGEGKTRGQVAILGIEAANNQNCAAIWVSETEIPSEYVYYWLWSRYEETRRGSSGNNQPALNKSIVESIPMPLPPLAELKLIIPKINTLFDAALLQEREIDFSINQSTAQRKNILRAAFAGELVPQDPNDEPASVLLERIQAERTAQPKKAKGRQNTPNKNGVCDEN